MTTIYVRIPRNRWTPIGEIDLDGWHQAYHDWKTAIKLNPEIEERMRKATPLSLKIRDYEKEHDVTTRADRGAAENRVYVKVLQKLEAERWQQSTYKYIRDELRPNLLKSHKESRRIRANDRALASLHEKLTGDRLGWYWQKQEVRDQFLNLPLGEAKEALKRAVQKQQANASASPT